MAFAPISVLCTDCEQRKRSLELRHFRVLGCDPDPTDRRFCLLRYEDPTLGSAAFGAASNAGGAPAQAAAAVPKTVPARAGGAPRAGAPAIAMAGAPPGAMPLLFAGKAAPLSEAGMSQVCERLDVTPAALWTVLKVETSGCGLLADRRPKILFERHKFSERTHGAFDSREPDVSSPIPGGYIGGAAEYQRLAVAMTLNRQAALESASWGIGQIMGFNASAAGFDSVEALIKASAETEDRQLEAMAAFLAHNRLDAPLRRQDWQALARGYNGANFKAKRYDEQLAHWHAFFAASGVPDIRVRQAQFGLVVLGYAGEGFVDGVNGVHTRDALARFQRDEALVPADGGLNDATLLRIRERAGWQ